MKLLGLTQRQCELKIMVMAFVLCGSIIYGDMAGEKDKKNTLRSTLEV